MSPHPIDRYSIEWDLIPAPKNCKHPGRLRWQIEDVLPRLEVRNHMAAGGNACVRLRKTQLVVDVDPKLFEHPDIDQHLFATYGIDPDLYPRVDTPNGGYHLYMCKPKDVPIFTILEGFEGIDFRSFGQQVVAAGSWAEVVDRDPHDKRVKIPTGDFRMYKFRD